MDGDKYNATPGHGLVDGERYQENVVLRSDPNRRRMQEDDAGRVTAKRKRALDQQYSGQFVFGPGELDEEFKGYPSSSNSLSPEYPSKTLGDNTPHIPNPHAPGSARVIPYVTDTEFASRMAAKSADILKGLDPKVLSKASGIKPKLSRVDQKNRMWTFTVPSAKEGSYTVKVKGEGKAVNAGKMDLKISCTCQDWVYGGAEHWAKSGGYLYGKPQGTAEAPTKRDPAGIKRVCKHVAAVLQKMESYSMGTSKKASVRWDVRTAKVNIALVEKYFDYRDVKNHWMAAATLAKLVGNKKLEQAMLLGRKMADLFNGLPAGMGEFRTYYMRILNEEAKKVEVTKGQSLYQLIYGDD
jgi:hypothetical protein